jgi:hypothetical protein
MFYLPLSPETLRRYGRAWSRSNPALLWWQTGVKTWQTMLAAPQVVAHRTARMAAAGPFPNLLDQREFMSMGTEKVIAFSQAWMGATREMLVFQQEMATVAARQWWTLMNAFNPGRAFPTPWNPMGMPAGALFGGMLSAGNRAMSAVPRMAHSAVSPVHARATSNAKRLRGS